MLENHAHSVALHNGNTVFVGSVYMHYNFCRIHRTLRVTPAMEAGVTNHVWEIKEVVALLERREAGLSLVDGN